MISEGTSDEDVCRVDVCEVQKSTFIEEYYWWKDAASFVVLPA